MLEGIVAGILSKYLGDFIVGLEGENLSLNISGGHVVLENLQFKKECLAELELPITVKEGFLGKFSLEIPWSSLGSKPAVAVIDRVFLLVGPTQPADYDNKLVKKKHLETKRRKLQVNELLASDPTKEDKQPIIEGEEHLSYTQKLVRTVIDNFQIFVKKVHFRYEDDISHTGKKFALGFTLENFKAESCDENWKSKFLKSEGRKFVHKLASVKNFMFYWSSDCQFLQYNNINQLGKLMENLIYEEGKNSPLVNDYILHPINGTLKIQLNQKDADFSIPKLIADLGFDQVIIQLKERQWKDILYMGNYFTYYVRGIKYHENRPDRRIRPAQNPLKWWKFAAKSIISEVKEKRAKKTWRRLEQYKRDRLLYIHLWRKKLIQKKKVAEQVLDQLSSLEYTLEYEDIVLFRSMAESLVRRDTKEGKSGNSQAAGWFGWVWGKKDDEVDVMEELTIDDWRYIYKDINFIEETKEDIIPADYVKIQSTFLVGEGSLELIGDDKKQDYKIIQAGFEGFQVEFEQRPKGESVKANILSVAVVDYFTLLNKNETVEMVSLNENQLIPSDTFFSFQYDRNPLDCAADIRLCVSALQSLNITFGMKIINRIVKFFSHEASADQLKLAANNTWENLKETAEVQVKYALDKRKIIQLEVDVVAPNVFIPSNFEDPFASMLIIELGTLSMRSDTKSRSNAIIRGSSGVDLRVNQEFYYDKYNVSMTSIHLMISDRTFTGYSVNNALNIDLIERFDINTDLYVCNVSSPDLPTLRLAGSLPKLTLLISPKKIGHLFSILRSFTASFGNNNNNSSNDLSRGNSGSNLLEDLAKKQIHDLAHPHIKLQKEEMKMNNLLKLEFEFTDLHLTLHRDSELIEGDSRELLNTAIHKLKLTFEKTNYYMKASLIINALHILDAIQKWRDQLYIISSKGDDDSIDLVSIFYVGISRTSPSFKSIEHSFNIHFNTLDVQVNRETIASLITYGNSILEEMKSDDKPLSQSQDLKSSKDQLKIIEELKTDSILLQVNLHVNCLKATLLKEGKKFIVSSLTDSVIRTSIHSNNEINLSGYLGNIRVRDLSPDTVWNEIVTITGDNRVFEFWFETINPDPQSDSLGKIIITLQISSVRYVLLTKVLRSLYSYLTEFTQMQNLISTTAKKAKETAENVTNNSLSKLIIFDISVANPHVIIPRSSNNTDYIVANLGDFAITNKLEKLDNGVMLDTILIDISSISMYSVNNDKNPTRRDIIKETNIHLTVYRPAFWNDGHKLADFSAVVKIEDISIQICELQYVLLLNILSGNLSEIPTYSKDLEELQEKLGSEKDILFGAKETDGNIILDYIKYKFRFQLSNTSLELLEGDGIDNEGESLSLVKLSIKGLESEGSLSGNSKLETTMNIKYVEISDTRPKIHNHFKYLLGPNKQIEHKLVQISYMKDINGNQSANIVIDTPRIVLLPDLLFIVKDYMLNNLNLLTKTFDDMKKKIIKDEEEKEGNILKIDKVESKSTPTGIYAKMTVIDPQVCLIEDEKAVDSRVLVLKQSVEIDFTINSNGVQHSALDIRDIQVYKFRSEDLVQILSPFDMSIHYESIPKEMTSIKILFGEIDLKISYTDFKLFMAMKNNWMNALPKGNNNNNLNLKLDIIEDKFKLKKRENKSIKLKEPKKRTEAIKIEVVESLKIQFKKINLFLLNDCFDSSSGSANTPLLEIAIMEMKSSVKNWSSALRGKASLNNMSSFYYNSSLNVNEPMIEPWDFTANLFRDPDGVINVSLKAQKYLNMNISKSFVGSFLNNLEQWQLDYYDKVSSNRSIQSLFYVSNETGVPLTYWITGTHKRITIDSGVEVALDFSEVELRGRTFDQDLMISVQLEDDELLPIHNLPISKKTSISFELSIKYNYRLLYTVDFRLGSRIITFGSDLLIINNTFTPLHVQLQNNNLATYYMEPIKSGEKKFIPIRYTTNSTIKFRPYGVPYVWSKELIKCNHLKREFIPLLFSCVHEDNSNAPNWSYSMDVDGEKIGKEQLISNQSQAVTLTLTAPLKIENTLPEKLRYLVKGPNGEDLTTGILPPGANTEIFHVIKDHRPMLLFALDGFLWSSPIKIGVTSQTFVQIESHQKRILSLGIDNITTPFGARSTTVFVKYWIYNKTGCTLKFKNAQLMSNANIKTIAGESKVVNKKSMDFEFPVFINEQLNNNNNNNIGSEEIGIEDEDDIQYIKPFIFSPDFLSVRKNTTAWSNSISLKSNGGVFEVLKLSAKKTPDPLHSEQLSVSIHPAPGKFWRTNIVKISPHYVLINKTNYQIDIRQTSIQKSLKSILNGEQIYFDWESKDSPKTLQFTFIGEEYTWSQPFTIDSANSFQVPVWRRGESNPTYLRITVNLTDTSVTVLFIYSIDDYPDYRIENYSSHPIIISELNINRNYKIASEYSIPFAWSAPLSPKKQIIITIPHTIVESKVPLDKLNIYPMISWTSSSGAKFYLSVEVIADGPTKVLIIDDLLEENVLLYEERLRIAMGSSATTKLEKLQAEYAKTDDIKSIINFSMTLGGVGLSIIDEKPQELLYFSMRRIDILFCILENTQSLELSIGSLQIDNQLYHSPYPIFYILLPSIHNLSFKYLY